MELLRTINSDKRYYLDENTIENAASFLQTMRVFNDAKIDLYNALYDQKYLVSGPLIDHAYPVFLKEKYKTNDYYNAAVYTAASGSISSQKELKKYYSTTIIADLKTRDEKIQMIQEALDKKKAVKNSIRIYRKDGRWVIPYPRCQLKVKGLTIVLFNKTIVKLDEYERSVEADIRKLKTRLALVTEARKRKEKKLENIKNLPPERIVFGGKKLYSEKDTLGITKSAEDNKTSQKALKEWKQEFFEKRHQSIALPGRHTSKYGNRKGNHHMTLFAYQRIASSIENQSLRREIAFCKIDPAYTSQMGKFLFMRRYGMSIHQAAAYTIGLVGMGLYDKLAPDLRMLNFLKTKEGIVLEFSQETYKTIWARITKTFSGISKHFFYRSIPYEVLEERKRTSLRMLVAEMKVRYMPKLTNYKSCELV